MREFTARPAVRWIAIGAAVVNLEIHAVLALDHGREMPYIGVLFVLGAVLLGVVVAGLSSGRDRRRAVSWIAGCFVSAGEAVLFVLSRTVGLPGDYRETWIQTPEDLLGLLSLLAEVIFIVCAAMSLTRYPATHLAERPPSRFAWHDRTAPLP